MKEADRREAAIILRRLVDVVGGGGGELEASTSFVAGLVGAIVAFEGQPAPTSSGEREREPARGGVVEPSTR